jgi:RES domain-containing protein
VRVWRLCRAAYAKDGLSGDGGLHAAGRWHVRGERVVYAAATLSLAALEFLVRVPRAFSPTDLVASEIDIPDSVEIERVLPSKLASGWDAYPAPAFAQQLGSRWLDARRTAVLQVPSAVIPRESNYLVNPAHPRSARIRVVARAPFYFDTRRLG